MERIKGETWDCRERKAFPLERQWRVSSGKCRLFRILLRMESRATEGREGDIKEVRVNGKK